MAEMDFLPLESNLQSLSEPKANKRLHASQNSSNLLADIKFERKNKPQPRLPPNHKIQKRPITHPPIAAPSAGPAIQKVVYVSQHTPIMAAVKRVRKLLEQVEKRKLQREGALEARKRTGNIVAAPQNGNQTNQEVVLVKACGRAIEQAARIGEWFKRHAEDGDGGWMIDIRPLSVKVIDDIVEDSSTLADNVQDASPEQVNDTARRDEPPLDFSASGNDIVTQAGGAHEASQADKADKCDEQASHDAATSPPKQKKSRKKRKRPMYDAEDVPEARTRFINAVEIAVSLKY